MWRGAKNIEFEVLVQVWLFWSLETEQLDICIAGGCRGVQK